MIAMTREEDEIISVVACAGLAARGRFPIASGPALPASRFLPSGFAAERLGMKRVGQGPRSVTPVYPGEER